MARSRPSVTTRATTGSTLTRSPRWAFSSSSSCRATRLGGHDEVPSDPRSPKLAWVVDVHSPPLTSVAATCAGAVDRAVAARSAGLPLGRQQFPTVHSQSPFDDTPGHRYHH